MTPRVEEMIGWLERLRSGEATRAQVKAWVDAVAAPYGEQTFPQHHVAEGVLGNSSEIESRDPVGSKDFVIRDQDVDGYLAWLVRGQPSLEMIQVAHVSLAPSALIERTGATAIRYFWPRLGWHEEAAFDSGISGRKFSAAWVLSEPEADVITVGAPDTDLAATVADLFETLAVDHHDTKLVCDVDLAGFPRWQVWRTDDNGNEFLVETYTSHAKAMRIVASFEASWHRQIYRIEAPRPA